MPPLRERLEQTQARLERKRAAARRLRAAPDYDAGPLFVFLVPTVGVIWAAAWWLAGSSLWLTGPFGTACTVFLFRQLPGQVISLHAQVVPHWAGWVMAGWLVLGWGGMMWLLATP